MGLLQLKWCLHSNMSNPGPAPEVVSLITKIVLNTATRQDFVNVSNHYSEIFESMTSNVSMSALESFGIKVTLNRNSFSLDDGGEYYLYGVAKDGNFANPEGYFVFHREETLL